MLPSSTDSAPSAPEDMPRATAGTCPGSAATEPVAPASTWRAIGWELVLVGVVVALGIWTRLHDLGQESLWLDEATTFSRSRMPIDGLIQNSVRKMHVPSYFILMHYVLRLGDDEWMLRIPSALFGMLKVPLVAGSAWIVGGARAAAGAGLLLVLSPYHLRYDQEARMYALQTFGTGLALLAQLWLLTHAREAAHCWPWPRATASVSPGVQPGPEIDARLLPRARLAWALWVVGVVFALYMHNTSALYMVASSAATLALLIVDPRVRVRFFVYWTIANLLVLLAWSGWLPSLLTQLHDERFAEREWGELLTLSRVRREMVRLLLGTGPNSLRIAIAALALGGVWQLRKRLVLVVALLLLSAGAPLLVALVSLHKPMFMPRIMLWGAPAFFVLAGCGLAALRLRALQLGVLLVVGWLGLADLQTNYYDATLKTDWRGAAHVLSGYTSKGTYALTDSFKERRPLAYYAARNTSPIALPPLVDVSYLNPKNLPHRFYRKPGEVLLVYAGKPGALPRGLAKIAQHAQLRGRAQLSRAVVERYKLDRPD